MEHKQDHGPQYLAHGGAKSPGPTQGVATQDTLSGIATCIRGQELAPGLLPRKITGEFTTLLLSSAAQLTLTPLPVQGATPVVVRPPTDASLKNRMKRQARKARLWADAEAVFQSQTKPTTSSIQKLTVDTEAVVQAVAGVTMKPLS